VGAEISLVAPCRLPLLPCAARPDKRLATEWVLMTSGTTGDPKMVVHTLATLTRAIPSRSAVSGLETWATFYDIRRYGGLQVFLRACAGNGSLTLRGADESLESFLPRAKANGVTHISGTPAHWRLVLMNAARGRFDPEYVRLSGEIADDSLLRALSALYPRARVVHAFASTEAGVVLEIEDGQAGFPAELFERGAGDVALKLVDGSLRVRSGGAALRYLGANPPSLRDADGYVDTGDFIRLSGERCFFAGRRGGIINIGGSKVHPEEVEAIINRHASVRASLVKARGNPITGSLVVAEVVLKQGVAETPNLSEEIIAACLEDLAPYKVPAIVRFVRDIPLTGAGKVARN
jgi:acyl-coenzyme A synthetase/AMP-(fatty) acid ligase